MHTDIKDITFSSSGLALNINSQRATRILGQGCPGSFPLNYTHKCEVTCPRLFLFIFFFILHSEFNFIFVMLLLFIFFFIFLTQFNRGNIHICFNFLALFTFLKKLCVYRKSSLILNDFLLVFLLLGRYL